MWSKIRYYLQEYDWLLVVSVIFLVSIGLAAIYSVDLSRGDQLNFIYTQLAAAGLGAVAMIVGGSMHIAVYKKYSRLFYFFSILLLVGVLFFGVTVSGTKGWYRFMGLSFQPVEVGKIGLILIMSLLTTEVGRRFYELKFFASSIFLTALIVGPVLLQPDLGSAMILIGIWVSYLLFTGVKKKYLLGLFVSFVAVALLGWSFVLADYQKERFVTFLNPQKDPLGAAYNLRQSIIAIGSGGWFGRGLGFGSQSQLKFLPEAHTDFVFSVIAEELGFIGSLLVILPFFVLVWRLIKIAAESKDEFGSYLVFGIAAFFLIQFFLNIGSAIGLAPIVGVTLPFVSYGGSSLVINLFLIGVVESVVRYTSKERSDEATLS
ncbi:MAG: FtsW/RodA/SpoVE family cell cycle protein [Candidatus Paceibacteria bacterium]